MFPVQASIIMFGLDFCIFGVCQKHKTFDEKIDLLNLLPVQISQYDYEQMSVVS